ncbi:MAG: ABC transporter ATP-binding protein [Chloroflexi bacterium]|nr:ABC transporter ATP-binding protein [Chloroflexota bacterium]
MRQPVIQLHNLHKRFGAVQAVRHLNLEVFSGECFGFLGPNGAGKTTTISMILGLLRPTAGRVVVLGEEVTPDHTAALRHVGALAGAPGFYPYLSGRANLRLLAALYPDVDDVRVEEVLALVGLQEAANRKAKAYSTGMKQRLGLAAALLHRPKLLILDEPTSGLDPVGMAEMRALLRKLTEEGITVFLSSHLLHEVEQTCDRVAILNRGQLVAQGPVADLLAGKHDLEEVFMAAVHAPNPTAA